MKHSILAAALLLAGAHAAQAQVTITYTKETGNSKLTISWSGGSYYGYGGYGGYYGGGYGGYYGGYSPGFVYTGKHGTFTFGTNFLSQPIFGGGYYPYGYGMYGTTVMGYGTGHYHGYGIPTYIDYQRVAYRPVGAAREVAQLNVEKTYDAGIAKFKAGDYAGALAAFKQIVINDFSNPVPKIWMALALAGSGDFKNAEKALRSASASNEQLGSIDLKASMKDAKEQARYAAAVEKAGGLMAGYILERLGDKAKAAAALDAVLKANPKDAEAERLKARTK